MKYRIVAAKDYDQLEERVNYALQEGWIPIGGMIIHKPDFIPNLLEPSRLCQTLIKQDEPAIQPS